MTIQEQYQYLRRMKRRYQKASRQERSRTLDGMEAYTGWHRNLIRSTAKNLARWGKKLAKISVATLRRILNSLHRDKPRPAPRPLQDHNPWRRDVPMLRLPYNLEVNLVHHCGFSASGKYVHTPLPPS